MSIIPISVKKWGNLIQKIPKFGKFQYSIFCFFEITFCSFSRGAYAKNTPFVEWMGDFMLPILDKNSLSMTQDFYCFISPFFRMIFGCYFSSIFELFKLDILCFFSQQSSMKKLISHTKKVCEIFIFYSFLIVKNRVSWTGLNKFIY